MSTFTVAVFNATGGSNPSNIGVFGTWFDDLECDAAIVSEVFRFKDVLRKCGHLRVGLGGHGQRDVGVITRRRPLTWSQVQVTKNVPRPGADKPLLWHDRWMTRVVDRDWNRIHSSHAPAVIQNPQTKRLLDNPGAREWKGRGLPTTESRLRLDMAHNRPVVHGADLNQRPGDGPENPAEMYQRLGMKWRNDGVMWFAWNPRRFALVSDEWLPTPPGSDGHATGLFTLRRLDKEKK